MHIHKTVAMYLICVSVLYIHPSVQRNTNKNNIHMNHVIKYVSHVTSYEFTPTLSQPSIPLSSDQNSALVRQPALRRRPDRH